MVDCLIFTRDRPMQLDACLSSLATNAPQIASPVILAFASNAAYSGGYDIVQREHEVRIARETHFAENARRILREALHGDFVLMLCDDSITYLPCPADPEDAMTDDVLGFSLRMGRNTTYCHPRDLHHETPEFLENIAFLFWEWHETPDGPAFEHEGREGDFGYPYSLDGMVHRRRSLLEWVGPTGVMPFENPNRMEGCVVGAIGQRTDVPPLLSSFHHSVQVGLPINVVNTTHNNRVGLEYPQALGELNRRYLDGERIRWQEMNYDTIIGAHQELELVIR